MSGIYTHAEQTLMARQQWSQGFRQPRVRPSYDGLGLANVPALILQWLNPEGNEFLPETLPPLQPQLLGSEVVSSAWEKWLQGGAINHVIFIILDGLGYDQLQELKRSGDTPNLDHACSSEQAFFMPITSVFPSTTTAALTSAANAYSPGQHGIVGTSMYLRELGSVVNFIGWRPGVAPTNTPYPDSQLNPDNFIPQPNMYLRLEKAEVQAEIINYHIFKQSSISRYTTVGSKAGLDGFHGYLTPQQGFAQLRDRILHSTAPRSFTYMYVPNIDASSHRYAPLSDYYRAEISSLDFALQRELLQPLTGRNDTVLILVADHGQRATNVDQILWLNEHPTINDNLFVPPTGSSQGRYLHVKHNQETKVIEYIQKHLDDDFMVISQAQAIELGLFANPGEPLPQNSCDRIGDLIMIPRDEWSCFHSMSPQTPETQTPETQTPEYKRKVNLGLHGGLTRAEMLIPFLAYRF